MSDPNQVRKQRLGWDEVSPVRNAQGFKREDAPRNAVRNRHPSFDAKTIVHDCIIYSVSCYRVQTVIYPVQMAKVQTLHVSYWIQCGFWLFTRLFCIYGKYAFEGFLILCGCNFWVPTDQASVRRASGPSSMIVSHRLCEFGAQKPGPISHRCKRGGVWFTSGGTPFPAGHCTPPTQWKMMEFGFVGWHYRKVRLYYPTVHGGVGGAEETNTPTGTGTPTPYYATCRLSVSSSMGRPPFIIILVWSDLCSALPRPALFQQFPPVAAQRWLLHQIIGDQTEIVKSILL